MRGGEAVVQFTKAYGGSAKMHRNNFEFSSVFFPSNVTDSIKNVNNEKKHDELSSSYVCSWQRFELRGKNDLEKVQYYFGGAHT